MTTIMNTQRPHHLLPFAAPAEDGQRPQVLVVDDDGWVRESVKSVLAEEGYAVHAAPHGAAALELLEAMARAGLAQPDLLLVDVRMPVMDGRAFAQECRARGLSRAPIVVITAAAEAARHAADIGADGALAKPFVVDELLATVSAFARRDAV
jgi:CheY-like chemotaxis protein